MRTKMILALNLAVLAGCAATDKNAAARRDRERQEAEWNAAQPAPSNELAISAQTRYAAGQLAESQGFADRAVEQYRLALKANPRHAASLYRLGVIFTQARQYPEAIESWKQYVAASGETAAAYNNLGFCQELAGRTAEAEQTYRQGIAKDPTAQACRVNYGLLLARTGREAEATEQLSAVLQPAEVHYNLASVYEQMGKKPQARTEYERALQLDPKLWEAQSRLSRIE